MMGFGLLGVVLLVGAAFVFMRNGSGIQDIIGTRNNHSSVEENAQQILDQRYARGELTREQYQKIKKDLA
ncbi:MAG: SHOCT domain-containing protein [Chloroflexi bacterium]|nr:SHOCT domain-containing protein [Chloroflexota bacterium]